MKKLILLLVLVALCVPAYGDILIYKVSIKVQGIAENGSAEMGKASLKGYLVLDVVDFSTSPIMIVDDTLLVYGKDNIGDKIYNSTNTGLWIDGFVIDSKSAVFAYMNAWGADLSATGKSKMTDIGTLQDEVIAKSLKGALTTNPGGMSDPLDPVTSLYGSGKVSAKLDSKYTKEANEDTLTLANVVLEIEDYLLDKGYTLP